MNNEQRNAAAASPAGDVERRALMRICSLATQDELSTALSCLAPIPAVADLKMPEVGIVMLRGRAGGSGQVFNFGEATVSRAVVSLADGTTGFGYVLGRDVGRARMAAIVDALGQQPAWRPRLAEALVEPVNQRVARDEARTARETAATKVDFFTLVRGED